MWDQNILWAVSDGAATSCSARQREAHNTILRWLEQAGAPRPDSSKKQYDTIIEETRWFSTRRFAFLEVHSDAQGRLVCRSLGAGRAMIPALMAAGSGTRERHGRRGQTAPEGLLRVGGLLRGIPSNEDIAVANVEYLAAGICALLGRNGLARPRGTIDSHTLSFAPAASSGSTRTHRPQYARYLPKRRLAGSIPRAFAIRSRTTDALTPSSTKISCAGPRPATAGEPAAAGAGGNRRWRNVRILVCSG
jgi:hypothetical protein